VQSGTVLDHLIWNKPPPTKTKEIHENQPI